MLEIQEKTSKQAKNEWFLNIPSYGEHEPKKHEASNEFRVSESASI